MEKITTVRLEINGNPAKNTLDELRRKAEQLADAISKVKSKENVVFLPNDSDW